MGRKKKGTTVLERFNEKFIPEPNTGCWLWLDCLNKKGYGQFYVPGERTFLKAHRAAYELYVGPIPEGLTIDHLCRVKHCVNPEHLEPVTSRENTLRSDNPAMQNSRKTHCIRGHELFGYNAIIDKKGNRECRKCGSKRAVECRQRKNKLVTRCPVGHLYDSITTDGRKQCSACSKRSKTLATHCKWGHELAGENLIIEKTGGRHRCRVCNNVRCKKYNSSSEGLN